MVPGSTVVVVGKVVAVVVVVVGKVVVVVVVVVGKVVVVVVVSVGSTVTAMMKASSRNPPTYGLAALFTEFKSARSVIDVNVPLILIEPQPAEAVAL